MQLMLVLLAASIALEILVHSALLWKHTITRLLLSGLAMCLATFCSGALLALSFSWATVLLAVVSMYRLINGLRIFENRMNLQYMDRVTLRSSVVFGCMQLLICAAWWVTSSGYISMNTWGLIAIILQLGAGTLLLSSVIRTFRRTKLTRQELALTTNEAPTVTVAIPARNETDDLYECLQSLLSNEYPKLEVLVLDDCSQLKRTPEIIRDFAHKGVRFVKGDLPKENWLAKNQAYDKLLREANGEIMLFCGVDMRFRPDTIRQIVVTMLARKKRMLCVLPLRHNSDKPQLSLIQASRYFWELAPPRRFFNRPPVLSSCWAIYRKDMLKRGGFAAVARSIMPEAYFAKQMIQTDKYSFMRANADLPVYSAKSLERQRDTAVRVRYPQLRKRPETVLFVSFIGVVCFVLPYAFAVLSLAGLLPLYYLFITVVAISLLTAAYCVVAIGTKVNSWYIAPFYFLPVILIDIALIHYSLYKYEFSEVIWKGRNICIPVMHVIPSLPKV